MPQFSAAQITTIVDLVQPLCGTENERRALIDTIFVGALSKPNIDTSGAPLEFTRRLVFRLIDYGEIAPGQPALWALLEIIRAQVGVDRQAQIDNLHDAIFASAVPAADYVVATEGGKLIFISYSTIDSAFADRLRADLSAAGLNLWIDRIGLKVGTPNWEDSIRDALKRADGVLLIASPESAKSNYVRGELAIAKARNKHIYPAWVRGDEWTDSVPIDYIFRQHVDLRGDKYPLGLKRLIEALGGLESTPTPLPIDPDFVPRNPYKGLKAFGADDRADFFGRDVFVNELIEALHANPRFLAVIGASGSGKSSVVMAGLLPRLHDGALPGSAQWVYLNPFVPGVRPIEALSIALSKHLSQKAQTAIDEDLLHPSARGLYRLAKQISQTRLVLYIDQFEELFTQTADDAERRQFIDLLTTAANEPDSAVTIVLTLRADFYDRPLGYADLGALFEAHGRAILPLTLADLYDVILKPVALDNVRLTFEPGLAEEMVFSVKGEAGALPLLQFTLDQLFQRRDGLRLTRAAYDTLGGVRGALTRHAEATFQMLDVEGQTLARDLFLRLIEPGVTVQDTTRRRASLSELKRADTAQTERRWAVAERFVKARLLTASEDTIEVSHEALIREWDRLQTWLNEDREDVILMKRIAADADEWTRKGQPEDALYRGRRLREAQDWVQTGRASVVEMEFIAAGEAAAETLIAAEERRKQELRLAANRAWIAVGFAAMIIFVAVIVGIFAAGQVNDATTQVANANATLMPIPGTLMAANEQVAAVATKVHNADIYTSRSLAGRAVDVFNSDMPLGVALALAASRVDSSPQTELALSEVAYAPGLRSFVQGPDYSSIGDKPFSPDGTYVVSASYDAVEIWDAATGDVVRRFEGDYSLPSFSPDGMQIVSLVDHVVSVLNAETGEIIRRFEGNTGNVYTLSFSPDGTQLVAGGCAAFGNNGCTGGELLIWNTVSGELVRRFDGIGSQIESASFSSDGNRIVAGGCGARNESNTCSGELLLWDVGSRSLPYRFESLEGTVTDAAFNREGTQVRAMSGGEIIIWDAKSGSVIRRFDGNNGEIRRFSFSPDEVLVAGYVSDCDREAGICTHELMVWDAVNGDILHQFTLPDSNVGALLFNSDGSQLVILSSSSRYNSRNSSLEVWDLTAAYVLHRFDGDGGSVNSVSFSPDGSQFVSGGCGMPYGDNLCLGELLIRDAQTGTILRRFAGVYGAVSSASFSPDGAQIVAAGCDDASCSTSSIRLWNAVDGELIRQFGGSDAPISSVSFNPNGTQIVSVSVRAFTVWDALRGEPLYVPAAPIEEWFDTFGDVSFSPDGSQLVVSGSSSFSGHTSIWDAVTGAQLLNIGTEDVTAMTFSPDGAYILIGECVGRDKFGDCLGRPSLLDTRTMTYSTEYQTADGSIRSIIFSPDGSRIVAPIYSYNPRLQSYTANILVWDVATGNIVRNLGGYRSQFSSISLSPDGSRIISASDDGTVIIWRNDTFDQLQAWTLANRYVPELTCEERAAYGVVPACVDETPPVTPTLLPTATPFPPRTQVLATFTPFASPTVTGTPTVTPTPRNTWTPGPSRTPTPLSITGMLNYGEPAQGLLATASDIDRWQFQGHAGDRVTIFVAAAHPAPRLMSNDERIAAGLMDAAFCLYRASELPSNDQIACGDDDSSVAPDAPERLNARATVTLPVDGMYRLVLGDADAVVAGAYTVVITLVTPSPPTATPTLPPAE